MKIALFSAKTYDRDHFELANQAAVARLIEKLEWIAYAESLGGVESLIEHPAIMTHASIPAATRGRRWALGSVFWSESTSGASVTAHRRWR